MACSFGGYEKGVMVEMSRRVKMTSVTKQRTVNI